MRCPRSGPGRRPRGSPARGRSAVDKAELTLSEPRRIRDLGHFAFVASQPCLICSRNRSHSHAQPTALGRKVSEEFTVSLGSNHPRELHQHREERAWRAARGVNALKEVADLWRMQQEARARRETNTQAS